MEKEKELLFSVTASDCDWSYTRGSGAGGQKRNKTSNAVHCTHRDSKAHGYSEATRSKEHNKRDAFAKMIATDKFKSWHKMEIQRKLGVLTQIEDQVEIEMRRIKVEVKQDGKWVPAPEDLKD